MIEFTKEELTWLIEHLTFSIELSEMKPVVTIINDKLLDEISTFHKSDINLFSEEVPINPIGTAINELLYFKKQFADAISELSLSIIEIKERLEKLECIFFIPPDLMSIPLDIEE